MLRSGIMQITLVLSFLLISAGSVCSQPSLRYLRMPEPPGGASRALAVLADNSTILLGGGITQDSTYTSGYWRKGLADVGQLGIWIDLPTPDSSMSSQVRDMACSLTDGGFFTANLLTGGWNGGPGVGLKPMAWRVTASDTTGTVLPTLGGGSGEGEALGAEMTDTVSPRTLCGWSKPSAGVRQAVAWRSDPAGMNWTLEPLPNFGSGLKSQANGVQAVDVATCITGSAETPGGAILPQVWVRNTQGDYERTTLPLPPGATDGAGTDVALTTTSPIGSRIACIGWTAAGGVKSATLWMSEDSMQTWNVMELEALPAHTQSEANAICFTADSKWIIAGTSYNTDSDAAAALWMEHTPVQKYNLNASVTGNQPDLLLRTATGIFSAVRDDIDLLYIVGIGVAPPSALNRTPAAAGDPHAWLLTDDLILTAAGEPTPLYDRIRIETYPNPFASGARISYTLPDAASVRLRIYDVTGRQVAVLADGFTTEGDHLLMWDGRDSNGSALASGIYFIRLETPGLSATRKMVLLR